MAYTITKRGADFIDIMGNRDAGIDDRQPTANLATTFPIAETSVRVNESQGRILIAHHEDRWSIPPDEINHGLTDPTIWEVYDSICTTLFGARAAGDNPGGLLPS